MTIDVFTHSHVVNKLLYWHPNGSSHRESSVCTQSHIHILTHKAIIIEKQLQDPYHL